MLAKSSHNSRPSGHKSMRPIRQSRRENGSVWQIFETVFLIAGLAGLQACQSTQQTPFSGTDGIVAGADFCQAARAIYYSRHDTPPTIAQIKEHNAVGVALKCGWISAKGAK